MKTLFYNAKYPEGQFLKAKARGLKDNTFIVEALSAATVHLSKSFDAISIRPADDASPAVLQALHENGIRYITIRAAKNSSLDLKKAAELGITVANVPFCASSPAAYPATDLMDYMVTVTFYNLACRKKDLLSGNELTCADHLPRATIYSR